jgi:hypothetical protein
MHDLRTVAETMTPKSHMSPGHSCAEGCGTVTATLRGMSVLWAADQIMPWIGKSRGGGHTKNTLTGQVASGPKLTGIIIRV